MTLSGPILGLNKRWKLKLHSKLQPACSRAVYRQFARNHRFKKKGWIVFLYSSVVVLLFSACFSCLDDRGTFKPQGTSTKRMRHSGKVWSLLGLVYLSSPQLYKSVHREAKDVNQGHYHLLCLSLVEMLQLQLCAAASNHGYTGPAFTLCVCCILVTEW